MRGVLELQIRSKDYNLEDILRKIDIFYANGSLTEADRTYLINLARENVDISQETEVMTKLVEIEQRLSALETVINSLIEDDTPKPYVDGKWYLAGNRVIWNDKTYECTIPDGQVCTWNPDLKPEYWNEVN